MIAEGVQFHRHSGEIELVEGGDVASEGGFGSGLDVLVVEEREYT